tara:strand:- start:30 stop:269 length:240 start_codon:yes stop_codon:yes gene_type:complete
MDIKIYTTPGCFYCEQMKELCKRAEVEYESEEIDSEELSLIYPDAKSYPYVIIDGEEIGGIVDAAKYFIKKGLVSARKD